MPYYNGNCYSVVFLVLRVYFLLFLTASSASFLDDQPYCTLRYRRLCQGKGQHVGCQYPNQPGPGPACHNYTQIQFTSELRHFIISYINKRRQRIAAGTERCRGGALIPKPQIMMMVVWDRELALLAQRLADQCSFIHDDCRATVRYPYAGQTVGEVRWRGFSEGDGGWSLSAQRAMRRVFDAWWGERRRVRPQQLMSPFRLGTKGSAWGHFSQLAVWALAAAGCGAARHGSPRRLLLVCDFSHTNMLGQSTLIPGEMAPCPIHYVRKSRSPYPLLCAPTRKPERSQSQGDEGAEYGDYDDFPTKIPEEEDATTDLNYKEVTHKFSWTKSERIIEDDDDEDATENSRVLNKFGNATRSHIIAKLEQELELNSSIRPKIQKKFRQRLTTRMNFGNIRENHENDFRVKARFKMNREEPYYMSSEEITTIALRHKWKPTRQRPRRPGADALLNKPVDKIIRRSSVAFWALDNEDMEQLFRDTGYHKHWKKMQKQSFP
ncbi:uncharacterized protein [Epargyreus clarus]|uniref:uncharacterized protein n=1 Tax=Epargyreus clarus TaxID=520877 RepID=UPI003C30C0DA